MWSSVVLAAALCQPAACDRAPVRTVVKAPVVAVVKVVEARPVRKALKGVAKVAKSVVRVVTPRRTCCD